MTCEEIEWRMAEYWSGTLSPEEEAAMDEHLAGCEACRAETERLSRLWQDLGQLQPPEPSAALRERFHGTLASYRDSGASGPLVARRPGVGWVWQIAAAVVLMLAGVGA